MHTSLLLDSLKKLAGANFAFLQQSIVSLAGLVPKFTRPEAPNIGKATCSDIKLFFAHFSDVLFPMSKITLELHDWCCIIITHISNWHRRKIWQSSCEDMSIILWPHQDHLMCTHSNDDHGMSTSAGNLYQDNRQFIVLAIDCNQQAKIITIIW